MKSLYISIAFIFIGLLSFGQSWSLEKEKDGIKVYTKSSEYRMKASKAVMTINAPINDVVDAIYNVKNYPKWMPDCAEISVLKESTNSMIYHGLYDVPWPATDRDMVLSVEKIKTANGMTLKMTNKPDYIAEKNKAVRIQVYFGQWILEETTNGTKVICEYQTDPGGGVPDWMIQGAAVKSPFNMFSSLKEYLGL